MAPTLTATAQATYARVQLLLTWAGITSATIQRLDPDGTWRNVRNAEPIYCGGSCAVYDHEAPLDQAVSYRATSGQGSGTVGADAFGRTVSGGWGTADTGGAWSTSGGAASDYATNGTVGQHTNTSVNVTRKTVLPLSFADGEAYLSVSTPVVATGAAVHAGIVCRYTDANNYLRFVINFQTDSTVNASIIKRVGGTDTTIASATVTSIASYTTGTLYRIHAYWSGSTLRMRVWPASGTEPTTWQVTGTDSSLTGAGNPGAISRLNTGNTNTLPVTVSFDDLDLRSLAALTVSSGSVTIASSGKALLSHPGYPAYGAKITVNALPEQYPARRGVFAPIGAALPVVVSDVRGGASGVLVFQTDAAADVTAIRTMIADGAPLLLRQPSAWGGDTWYVSVADVDVDRYTRYLPNGQRRWSLPYLRVDRPPGAAAGAVGITCDDVKATYATCSALAATGKTCTDLARSVT